MLDITTHKNILLRILKDIYTNSTLGPLLGFKGGTAAYLFYDLGRFSVDLDFDLLNNDKQQDVYNQIDTILKEYGTIKQRHIKRYTLFSMLSYKEHTQNIKVEINKRNFGSHYELKNYLGIPMLVMQQQDIAAHKLVAMYERMGKANRDIFDVWFILKNNWPINQAIITQRTHLTFDNFIDKCITSLEKVSSRTILSGLGSLLDNKQKIWAKAHLKDDTIFLLKLLIN